MPCAGDANMNYRSLRRLLLSNLTKSKWIEYFQQNKVCNILNLKLLIKDCKFLIHNIISFWWLNRRKAYPLGNILRRQL